MFHSWRCVFISGLIAAAFIDSCTAAEKIKLPDGFKICSRSDSNFKQCLVEAADTDIRILAGGYPELGIPPLNPFQVPQMKFSIGGQGTNEQVAFTVELDNTQVSYVLDKIKDLQWDEANKKFLMIAQVKELTMNAKHKTNGRFFFAQLNGHGSCTVTLNDATIEYRATYNLVKRDGEEYVHFEDLTVKLVDTKKVTGYYENLIGNNKNVNDGLNTLINENWKTVYAPVFPVVERESAIVVIKEMNHLSDKVPYNQLFPE